MMVVLIVKRYRGFREAGQKFVTYKIDKDFTPESFFGEFGEGSTFPCCC